ncbi:uncharacterized protein ACMZJ9_003440 [Mantella aurantiaca]
MSLLLYCKHGLPLYCIARCFYDWGIGELGASVGVPEPREYLFKVLVIGELWKSSTGRQDFSQTAAMGHCRSGNLTLNCLCVFFLIKAEKSVSMNREIQAEESTRIEMASRGCLRSADAFCYVCGHFIKTRARKYSVKACRKMCEAYKAYFGMPVGDQDKSWAPHVTCEYCKKTLEGWYRGEKRAMKFAIPRIWREPTDHSNNCYFCMVEPTKRRTGKNAPQIVYPDLPSSIAPVPHCPQLPVPTPPTRDRSSSGDNSKSDSEEDTGDLECDFTDADDEKRPYFPNQKDINDLIRDLGLTKSNAELLTSRLKQWNLLDESVQVTEQRSRHQTVSIFFRNPGFEVQDPDISTYEAVRMLTAHLQHWEEGVFSIIYESGKDYLIPYY